MIFEFTTAFGFDFITFFAKHITGIVRDNFMEIPNSLGEGYVRKIGFGSDFKLTIHRYMQIPVILITPFRFKVST